MKKVVLLILSHMLTAMLAGLLVLAAVISIPGTGTGYNKLVELEELIMECFVGVADRTKMEDAAADAMIKALGDRWSYYISADELESFNQDKNNAYVGIGVTVTLAEDNMGLLIREVTVGGPAEEAGLLAGDVIVEAGGVSLSGLTSSEAGAYVKGEEGSLVTLMILRDGEELTLEVERRSIRVPVAVGVMLDEEVGMVTIENFNANCFDETKAAIEMLLERGATKLIFDVRNNGGGYASEMVDVLDYLLPEGQLFKMVGYDGEESIDYSDEDCLDIPMAVLVNGGSYSAAECFAAALKEYDAAFVVGEQTSGKGFYQVVFTLKDGSAVGLSIGKYYTPHNNNLEGIGLTPDHVVEVDDETAANIYAGVLKPEEDPQVLKAWELLKGK